MHTNYVWRHDRRKKANQLVRPGVWAFVFLVVAVLLISWLTYL